MGSGGAVVSRPDVVPDAGRRPDCQPGPAAGVLAALQLLPAPKHGALRPLAVFLTADSAPPILSDPVQHLPDPLALRRSARIEGASLVHDGQLPSVLWTSGALPSLGLPARCAGHRLAAEYLPAWRIAHLLPP